jgi:hypothetical protein
MQKRVWLGWPQGGAAVHGRAEALESRPTSGGTAEWARSFGEVNTEQVLNGPAHSLQTAPVARFRVRQPIVRA